MNLRQKTAILMAAVTVLQLPASAIGTSAFASIPDIGIEAAETAGGTVGETVGETVDETAAETAEETVGETVGETVDGTTAETEFGTGGAGTPSEAETSPGGTGDGELAESLPDGDIGPSGAGGSGMTEAAGEREIEAEQPDAGTLRIEFTGAAPSKASTWNIELTPESEGESLTGTAELPASARSAYSHASFVLEGIPAGGYTLTLTPDEAEDTAYLAYEQDLTIGRCVTTLKLINGDPADYGYDTGSAGHYGILAMGDIDADGAIDEEDLGILTRAIARGADGASAVEEPYRSRADLNGDGSADLLDAACFAKYYGNDALVANREATPVTSPLLKRDDVTVATDSNATPAADSASVEELFSGSSETPLKAETEEPISEETPAVIATEFKDAVPMAGLVIDPVPGSEDSIVDGEIIVTDDDGTEYVYTVKNGETQRADGRVLAAGDLFGTLLVSLGAGTAAYASEADMSEKSAKPIVIDLGGQVAVKKIKIKVTKTLAEDPSLVDISKVEFYDDMADRIPEPELSVPEKLEVVNGSEEFTVSWKNMPNVSAYEVSVTGLNDSQAVVTGTRIVETNRITVTGFGDLDGASGDLWNGSDYTVVVRSVNGSWRSAGASVTARPDTSAKPPAPENIVLDPGYQQIRVSWKNMKDTQSYTLYYKATEDGTEADRGNAESVAIEAGKYSHTLTGLADDAEYEIWLVGHNKNGDGPDSIHYRARTSTLNPPDVPDRKLINRTVEGEDLTQHILSATIGTGKNGDGSTENGNTVVDGNYATYWYLDDWDAGYHYGNKMPTVKFDEQYKMNTVVLVPDENQPYPYSGGRIFYKAEDGTEKEAVCHMSRYESNGKYYYMFTSYEPFTTDEVRLAVYAYSSNRRISVAELRFYDYDEIEDEIMGLYADEYHISLAEGVEQGTIDGLRERLDETDPESGEQHPRREELSRELDNAQKLLDDKDAEAEIRIIDNRDADAADAHITFRSGLNTYQPLGVATTAGETVTLYVGGPNVLLGSQTKLELVEAQYHGSSSAVFTSLGYLHAGLNTKLVTAVDKVSEYERGGQLYVRYTGNPGAEEYGVRVIGGRKSAVLDLSDETSRDAKIELAKTYIADVKEQLQNAEAWHDADHGTASGAENTYEHDPKNCVYHATDIVSRFAMYSTSVDQVMAGLKEAAGSEDDTALAEKLVDAMDAMDGQLTLYYQHKGLSDAEDAGAKNRMPVGRINIRYQRMFYGAFMYAGGKHIGIEWPELKGLMGASPVLADADGRYTSGKYLGWGIGHEIGHEINEGAYVTPEVTNNYFAILSQAEQSEDPNDDVRFKYEDVYKKVTSGTKGKAGNVFTQLAMYWQLHLAYDLGGYNYKIYDTYAEQYDNLFWARVDSIVRDNSKAPGQKPDKEQNTEGNLLDLNTDKDNKLMRLAVAASGKDLLEMFRRYGYEPNEGTIRYASQFPKETRALWFANDKLRTEQIAAGGEDAWQDLAASMTVSGSLAYTKGTNEVTVNLRADPGVRMLEIYRSEYVKGETVRRPVGYAIPDGSGNAVYTDVIGSVNNRAFTYDTVGYDMWLNPTETATVGSVKVSHDGLIDKSLWTVRSNLTNGERKDPDIDDPDTFEQPGLGNMTDNNNATSFTGSVKPDAETEEIAAAEIILDFGKPETVTGVRYKAQDGIDFKAYVSMNAAEWTAVEMKTTESCGDGTLAYFDDGTSLHTYEAAYMKLIAEDGGEPVADGREITVSEISVLGQTGDNVEITAEDGIGVLSETYENGSAVIEKGSLVFTGTYKGNPAYNAVLLWDEEGNIVGGTDEEGTVYAEQIIFAPQPQGKLTDVSDGRWVYYVTPDLAESAKASLAGHRVRAELYRVDDALTNAGERLVSSTMFVDIPEEIPEVTLSTGGLQ